jgi:hypothetical protein
MNSSQLKPYVRLNLFEETEGVAVCVVTDYICTCEDSSDFISGPNQGLLSHEKKYIYDVYSLASK